MIAKLFEIRDRATFIPIMAVQCCPIMSGERYLLSRAGYGPTAAEQIQYVLMCEINGGGGKVHCDPIKWGRHARTLQVAHQYIMDNWINLLSGDVIDVEYILGETTTPKVSEQYDV